MKRNEIRITTFPAMKSISVFLFWLLLGSGFLLLYSCAGNSLNSGPDLLKTSFEEEVPNDPALSDAVMCKAAGDIAKKSGYNPPVCLYIGVDGKIKARPGGSIAFQNTPNGLATVMMLANTGMHPIRVGEHILKIGEVAFWKKSGNIPPVIEIPGIVLTPARE